MNVKASYGKRSGSFEICHAGLLLTSSLQVEHPAQYLEGGIFASSEGNKKPYLGGGRRLWMPQMDGSFQVRVQPFPDLDKF